MLQTLYETNIQQIGASAADFLSEGMFILFGENAPAELSDFCLLISINKVNGSIEAGDILTLNGKEYCITAVGEAVKKNLEALGHITLKFDGSDVPELPGSLYLEKAELTLPKADSKIQIVKRGE
ncbi:PTS glucitol/sorbitol transporter subunit IIA [Bacillus sp. YC2]|uniref:PTS glucitol/sorbitol transporter subunit IIA n=1 Tax=Bacillus sp. YC2 TaxID=2861287 RepID=UPI00292F6F9A|nr:PTS glucitol/sorbitol transporter subunit IIA [Bacillus sp. YC2]